jgi:hypothetical protein
MDFYDPGKQSEMANANATPVITITLDAKRSRLLTVTIDVILDICDFDATKHIIFKDQSVANRPLIIKDTTSFDTAFNLIGNNFVHGMFMALTSKNIMVKKVTSQ